MSIEKLRELNYKYCDHKDFNATPEELNNIIFELGNVDFIELANLISMARFCYEYIKHTKFRNFNDVIEPDEVNNMNVLNQSIVLSLQLAESKPITDTSNRDFIWSFLSYLLAYLEDVEANLDIDTIEKLNQQDFERFQEMFGDCNSQAEMAERTRELLSDIRD